MTAATIAAAEIALELSGDRVTGRLAELAAIELVVALFEVADVLRNLVVLGRHLVDELLPLVALLRQFGERYRQVEHLLDAVQEGERRLRVRWLRHVVRDAGPERDRRNAGRDARVLEHAD